MDIHLDITDLSPISGYQYKRRAESSSSASWVDIPNSGARNHGESIKSYTVTGLTNGTAYAFQVRTKNLDGTRTRFSSPSNEVYATPKADAPGVPTGLTAQAGDKEVMLSWSAPADNGGAPITGYEYSEDPTSIQGEWPTATRGTDDCVHRHLAYIGDDVYRHLPHERPDVLLPPSAPGTATATRARVGEASEGSLRHADREGQMRLRTSWLTAPVHGGEVELKWTEPE